MVYAFDSLGYAKRLRDRGIPQEQAEAHAEAARDFIMAELVTKPDLLAVKADVIAVKNEVLAVKNDLLAVKNELQLAIDNLGLRLTVRLGVMVAAGVATLAAIIKLS